MGAQESRTLGDALAEAGTKERWAEWVRFAFYEEPSVFCREFVRRDSEVYYREGEWGFDGTADMRRAGVEWRYYFVLARAGGEAVDAGEAVGMVMRVLGEGGERGRVVVVTDGDRVPEVWERCLGDCVRAVTASELAPLLLRPIARPGLR